MVALCLLCFAVPHLFADRVLTSALSMSYDDVEIEDMEWNEELNAFTYPCPCGDLFQITKVTGLIFLLFAISSPDISASLDLSEAKLAWLLVHRKILLRGKKSHIVQAARCTSL